MLVETQVLTLEPYRMRLKKLKSIMDIIGSVNLKKKNG